VHSAYLYMFIEWQTNNKNFQSAFIFQSAFSFQSASFPAWALSYSCI